MRRNSRGFAFAEMLLVIVIIGVIAGLAVFLVRQQRHRAANKHTVTIPTTAQVKADGSTETIEKISTLETTDDDKTADQELSIYDSAVGDEIKATSSIGDTYNDSTF